MLEKIFDGFQSLHFNIFTLNPTRAKWVERWSKVMIISFKRPTMWVSSVRDGKTHLGARVMVSKNVQ